MMEIINWLNNLSFGESMVIGYVLSAAVQALPKPDEFSHGVYQFIYSFAHILSANWKHVMQQLKEKKHD